MARAEFRRMNVLRRVSLIHEAQRIASNGARRPAVLTVALALVDATWRTVLLLALLLGAVTLVAVTSDEADRKRLQLKDTSSIAVFEQMVRARSIGSVDLLLIGDSSCLTGIDVDRLSERLGKRVASLCSIGYLGPAGYALLLQSFAQSGSRYKQLILAMHPDSMIRDESWHSWTYFVRRGGPTEPRGLWQWILTGLQLAERSYLSTLVRFPMRGAFGLYYGSAESMREAVSRSGMMIEPSALEYSSMAQFLEVNHDVDRPEPQNGYCQRYHQDWPNSLFVRDLEQFRNGVDGISTSRARFLLTPLPRNCSDGVIEGRSAIARARMIQIMGSPPDFVVAAPTTLPTAYFGSVTHLNLYGRDIYTDRLAAILAPLLAAPQ
jgi:hypothetical protein